MQYAKNKIGIAEYTVALVILIGFALLFSYDLYTLKKYLAHPDFVYIYYSFRYQFLQRLLSGEFPIWNPFFGIGTTAQIWATFPIDIYTPLEIVFGPQYHYFQVLQAALILLTGFYALVKLDVKPIVAVAGTILFFMSPWVTYFYLYFINTNSFISFILLFLFIYQWHKTKVLKYLIFITLTTIFSLFGTKAEYWFYQVVSCGLLSLIASFLFHRENYFYSFKRVLQVILAIVIGILAHAWQLNLMVRIFQISGRSVDNSGLSNLFSGEMYHNLLMSIMESSLWQMLVVGLICYALFLNRKQFSKLFWISVFTIVVEMIILIQVVKFHFPISFHHVILSFIKSPYLFGAILGLLIAIISSKNTWRNPINWRLHIETALLFLLFIYYYCRPERGDLGEMEIMAKAPIAFKILLSSLVWLGCMKFRQSKLVQFSYLFILSILVMRDQGQILLAYLTGLVWMPTREQFLIDWAIAVIAVIGLSSIYKKNVLQYIIASLSIGIIIFSASSNYYYSHPLIRETPSDYPYYTGLDSVKKTIQTLKDSPTWRMYFADVVTGHGIYGAGTSVLQSASQVAISASLIPNNYKNWTIYKKLGIKPDEKWGGYPNEYTKKTISKLPVKNSLGYENSFIYRFTIGAIPPLEKDILKLLGIQYVVQQMPISYQLIRKLELKYRQKIKDGLYVARVKSPLPRAFLVHNVSNQSLNDFMNSLEPIIDKNSLKINSTHFPLSPATINEYQPEYVSITTNSVDNSYLVLTDLYHPFWQAKIDGIDTTIIPALYLFRGIELSPGKHKIEFYAKVPYFKLSIFFSLFIFIIIMISGIYYYKVISINKG